MAHSYEAVHGAPVQPHAGALHAQVAEGSPRAHSYDSVRRCSSFNILDVSISVVPVLAVPVYLRVSEIHFRIACYVLLSVFT